MLPVYMAAEFSVVSAVEASVFKFLSAEESHRSTHL